MPPLGGSGARRAWGRGWQPRRRSLRAAAGRGPPVPTTRRGRCPSAPPARPRRSDHGLFLWGAGLESGPRRLRGRSANSAHRLAAIGGHLRQNTSPAPARPEPRAESPAATHRRRVLRGVCTGCRRRPGGRPRLVPACAARALARPVRLGMPRAEGRARRGRAR